MSSFAKKNIIVDGYLSRILGYQEGSLVSYAEITKGIYDYIKDHHLRKEEEPPAKTTKKDRYCFNCGAKVLSKAKFCDKCGRKQ